MLLNHHKIELALYHDRCGFCMTVVCAVFRKPCETYIHLYLLVKVYFYLLIFTHAIHLEFTKDLISTSFLLGFRQFASKKCLFSKMMSDNAIMFKGTSHEMIPPIKAVSHAKTPSV